MAALGTPGRAEVAADFCTWGEGGHGRTQAVPFMSSRLFKVARASGCSTPTSAAARYRACSGFAAPAARSFRMAAPAWKPNVRRRAGQPARVGFLPYGIPRLGQVACQAADHRPPPRIVSEWMNSFLMGWHGALGTSATIKLPHSHLIFHTPGDPTALRLAEGGCWCL
jgi:hypothetical protein